MTEPSEYFLETSAQIARLCGTSVVRNRAEKVFGGANVYTSTTVYLEFLRTVIWAFQITRRTIDECQPDRDAVARLDEIDSWLSETTFAHSERQVRLLLKVTSALKARFGGEPETRCGEVIDYINDRIYKLGQVRFFFLGGVDIRKSGRFIDITGCELVHDILQTGILPQKRLSCNRMSRHCSVRTLLRLKEKDVLKVGGAFAACTDARKDTKAVDAIDRVMDRIQRESNNDSSALGENDCWRLGDVIIGLECPKTAWLVSNDKHFEIICPALAKGLLPISGALT